MSTAKKSQVWDIFTLSSGIATCNCCKKAYKYTGSTSSLTYHIKTKHSNRLPIQGTSTGSTATAGPVATHSTDDSSVDQTLEIDLTASTSAGSSNTSAPVFSKQENIDDLFNRKKPYSENNKHVKDLDKLVVRMICMDLQPFSVVEDQGFVDLVQGLDPKYQLPGRNKVSTTLLTKMYDLERSKVQQDLNDATFISLTSDMWTSRATQGYLTVTAHCITPTWELKSFVLNTVRVTEAHTAENITRELQAIIANWNLTGKIESIVTDNGQNMVNAAKNVPSRQVSCFAHTINLVVNDSLVAAKDLESTRKRVRAIVSYFHHSSKASDILENLQGTEKLKLMQEVSTRWNSTYTMLERYLILHNEVTTVLCRLSKATMCISDTEIEVIRAAVKQLEPFYQVTKIVSGESYLTMSSVLPLINNIHDAIIVAQDSELKQLLINSMNTRFLNHENTFIYAATAFLDPRFKTHAFKFGYAVEKVKRELAEQMTPVPVQTVPQQPSMEVQQPPTSSLWARFDQNIATVIKNSSSVTISETTELRRLMEEPPIPRHEDPLYWWKTHDGLFPQLAQLAKRYLSVPATSVPSERLFSVAGQLISQRRANLSDDKIDQILFLNKCIKKK